MGRISVILPVYNEDKNIQSCLRGLATALRDHDHEILVCHDFEGDTTLTAIAAMEDRPPGVRLVRNDLGPGVAFALRAGFRAAEGDVVVVTMADLSDPPEVIPRMAARIREEGMDVVSGSRYMKGGRQEGGPPLKRFLSRAAGWVLHRVAGVGTHDATTNFRAYSRRFLEGRSIESVLGFEIGLELTVKAHLEGRKVGEVASTWTDRTAGRSRFRLWKWMPAYLRWFGAAMAGPAVAWISLVALLLWMPWTRSLPLLAATAGLGLAGAAALRAAQARRGRLVWQDLLLPLAWLHPGFPRALETHEPLPMILVSGVFTILHLLLLRRDESTVPAPFAGWRGRLLAGVTAAGLWLMVVQLPEVPLPQNVDDSWRMALNEFHKKGLKAGADYVFTMGPLGRFYESIYDPDLLWGLVAFDHLIKLVAVLLVVTTALRRRGGIAQLLGATVLLLLLPHRADALYLLAAVAGTLRLLEHPRPSAASCAALLLLLSVLGMMKFTFLLMASVCGAVLILSELRAGGRWRAVGLMLLLHAVVTGVWMASGQDFLQWREFLRGSLEIAAGYADAMSQQGPVEQVILALLGGAAALALAAFAAPRSLRGLLGAGVAGAGLFMAWKAGFVRHDPWHAPDYFRFLGVVPLFFPGGGRLSSALALACALVAFSGFFVLEATPYDYFRDRGWQAKQKIHGWAAPGELRAAYESQRRYYTAKNDLPRIREVVGDASIDLFSSTQGLLIVNGFNWTPRPVFQGYAAYAPRLADRNAEFIRGPKAPAFVLVDLKQVWTAAPAFEDSAALDALFRRYVPVLQERDLLLFRKDSADPSPERETFRIWALEFGQEASIDPGVGRPLALSVELRSSGWGSVRRFLFRPPRVFLEVDSGGPAWERYRIVPGLSDRPFLIDPLFRSQKDLLRWVEGEELPATRGFRIVADPGGEGCFEPGFRVSLVSGAVPRRIK